MSVLAPPAVASTSGGGLTVRETQRVILYDVPWDSYVAVGAALPDRPRLRMTFDRGTLEIMTTSPEHEKYKRRLGRLLEALVEEFGLGVEPLGNMTFRRKELERGLEPDECFWIANEPLMRAKLDWDPTRDPPPDLVLEIEISRSAMNRMSIYAALGVPEVWRCDGSTIRAHLLQPDGGWLPSDFSPTFPKIPLAGIVPFLQPSETVDYLSMVRAFGAWVREQLAKP
jgi:Uma2 family endonuclease